MSYFLSVAGVPLVRFPCGVHGLKARRLKRGVDLGLLLIFVPFAILIAVPLMITLRMQGGPVFYSQMRVGKNGRYFRLWKFRTMAGDADMRLHNHLTHCSRSAAEWASTGKLREDPRIHPLGRFLRRMSLDELPQLWNVARGEMSLVGPRPVRPEELRSVYGASAVAYESCLPGLSGLWQVSGRNRLNYEQRVTLDRHYAHNRSLRMDLWILRRTVWAVLSGSGC